MKVAKETPWKHRENDWRIRKYPNRRLYCPVENRYIVIADVWQRVKEGKKVEIIEWATGEDITKHILLEIVHQLEINAVDQFVESELIDRIRNSSGELLATATPQAAEKRSAA